MFASSLALSSPLTPSQFITVLGVVQHSLVGCICQSPLAPMQRAVHVQCIAYDEWSLHRKSVKVLSLCLVSHWHGMQKYKHTHTHTCSTVWTLLTTHTHTYVHIYLHSSLYITHTHTKHTSSYMYIRNCMFKKRWTSLLPAYSGVAFIGHIQYIIWILKSFSWFIVFRGAVNFLFSTLFIVKCIKYRSYHIVTGEFLVS